MKTSRSLLPVAHAHAIQPSLALLPMPYHVECWRRRDHDGREIQHIHQVQQEVHLVITVDNHSLGCSLLSDERSGVHSYIPAHPGP